MISFSVGVKRTFKNSEGNYDSDFFNYIMWSPLEFYKNNLKKGTKVYVQARLNNRSYDKDGQKQYVTDYTVEHLEILSKLEKKEEPQNIDVPQNTKTEYDTLGSDVKLANEDLPF